MSSENISHGELTHEDIKKVKENLNPFEIAQQQLDEAAKILNLESGIHQILRWPMREYHVHFPVKMDDGSVKIFEGFRVQYNNALGPTKGGIRFHIQETIDTVRALAAWMTWKTSLLNLPLGGGKGGVICNPRELSQTELERLCRGYMRAVASYVGPKVDVPAPDVNTNPQTMSWMLDEYETIMQAHNPGVITGKPLRLGGSAGRFDATSRGALFTIREAAKHLNVDLNKVKIAIQGYGNVGSNAAILMKEFYPNCQVVAVSDEFGAIKKEDGFDPQKVLDHVSETGSVNEFPGSTQITNEELLEMDVDVLIPCAIENVITEENAARIKAKIIAEGANGPTTPKADKILFENGKFVIPDFLCNAGGVTVSYFEQVQDTYNYFWTDKEVHEKLDTKMTKAFADVLEMSKRYKVHMRTAAYLVAIERVAGAIKLRGWL